MGGRERAPRYPRRRRGDAASGRRTGAGLRRGCSGDGRGGDRLLEAGAAALDGGGAGLADELLSHPPQGKLRARAQPPGRDRPGGTPRWRRSGGRVPPGSRRRGGRDVRGTSRSEAGGGAEWGGGGDRQGGGPEQAWRLAGRYLSASYRRSKKALAQCGRFPLGAGLGRASGPPSARPPRHPPANNRRLRPNRGPIPGARAVRPPPGSPGPARYDLRRS